MEIVGAEPPNAERIRERHDRLLTRLRETAAVNGHDPDRLRIVAVTKTWPAEVARAALEAGLGRLGESRIQEAEPKIAAVPEAEWHFIGRLQSNKARRAVRGFAVIHSVDSFDLLRRIDELSADEGRRPGTLLQVNVTGETAKAGLAPDAVLAGASSLRTAGLGGLMTMAPMGASFDEARSAFARLRELRDRLEQQAGIGLPELSMGMSADAEAAAAEGATLVRIGTALFGPRR
jgi:PLP dependent protein